MILALDLGSSSTRATLYADDLAPINEGSARALVSFTVDDYGRNEDALDAAWQRLTQTLDAISPVAMRHQPVTRLAVASYATSLVCLDAAGTALTPVFTYADTRAASAARALRERQDETAALSRTGCRIRANYWPARLAWLRETQPETIAHTRYFCSLIDALALHLFGRTATGISVSAWTGLVNTLQRDWDDAWLNTLGIERAQLPEILPHGASLVGLLPEWARRWPWLKDARMAPPLGDGAAANIGSGCYDLQRIAVTVGTTAAMRVVTSTATQMMANTPVEGALWRYFVNHERALIGGATTEGGNVFSWAEQLLQLTDKAWLDAELARHDADTHGLTVLPTLAGERSPGYAEDIRGTIHGISLGTTPVEIARALYESVALRLAEICAALKRSGAAAPESILIASGGRLQHNGRALSQMIADACAQPLYMTDLPEATSFGAALAALWNDGLKLQPEVHLAAPVLPDARRSARYAAAGERQRNLYRALYGS